MTRIKTSHGRWGRPLTMTLDELAETLRSDRYAQKVERIALRARDARADADTDDVARRPVRGHDSLPYLIFSSLFSQVGIHDFSQPTGLLLLSITLDGDSQARALLRSRVTQLPQTLMAFTGTSRRTLKVVARCSPADGPLPADSTAYLAFLGMAQQQAARYFEACCQCHVTREKESLERGCRMSHDPEAYYNPEAQPLTVTGSMLGVLDRYPLAVTDRQGRVTSEPSWEEIERERADFYTCVTKAMERVTPTDDDPASVEQLVIELAELCRKSGLPEESAVKRTGYYRRWHLTEDMVRKIFHTVYVKHPEGRPWSQMSEKERIARKVEDFFDRRYELRYNEMKGIEEFRPRGIDYHPWQVLDKRDIRRIAQEQMLDAGAAWPIDIEQYARSSIVRNYNPVHEFLAGCGTWDRKRDYIGQMARRVPCRYREWPQLFHRWFLGMVAGWLGTNRDFGNAVVPMLIGPQGCRKTTFCKLLLPHSMREYYIDDIKMDNAEQVERMLGRMALVNIDEYNAKTDREQAKIKRILTERDVQVRRMRSDQYTMTQRMSSFIATTNERQPLNDATGSRRYLCVEVTGTIDTATPINYRQLYAQALWEIAHGEPYYMSPDEEAVMVAHNQSFQNASTADILLGSYYRPAPRSQENFIRAVDILADLQGRARGADRPNMQQLVKALKAARYEYGAVKGARGWYAKKLFQVSVTP